MFLSPSIKEWLTVPEELRTQSIEINKDGDLVVTFTDGTVSNLGRVTGADGKVYVPHIDKNTSVLSWTIEDKEGEVPDPIDLSDSGEGEEIAKDKKLNEKFDINI